MENSLLTTSSASRCVSEMDTVAYARAILTALEALGKAMQSEAPPRPRAYKF